MSLLLARWMLLESCLMHLVLWSFLRVRHVCLDDVFVPV